MSEDKISVMSTEFLSSNKDYEEKRGPQKEAQVDKDTSAWNICHVFSVTAICVVFLVPVTLIPRTNSIYYQAYWYEFN